jgi:outer membrane protein assembly factor BamB
MIMKRSASKNSSTLVTAAARLFLLAYLFACTVAHAQLALQWQNTDGWNNAVPDARGNVYAVSGDYYAPAASGRVTKFGLFGQQLWTVDLTQVGFHKAYSAFVLPNGDPVIYGISQSNQPIRRRCRATNGTEVWTQPAYQSLDAVLPDGTMLSFEHQLDDSWQLVALNQAGREVWRHAMPEGPVGYEKYVSVSPSGALWVGKDIQYGAAFVAQRLDPKTGATLFEATLPFAPAAFQAAASGAVIVSTVNNFKSVVKLDANAVTQWTVNYTPSLDIPNATEGGNIDATLALDTATGATYVGLTSGNRIDEDSDGSVNGFAILKINRAGHVEWQHRVQTTDVAMSTPRLKLDGLGRLLVSGSGYDSSNRGWSRFFALSSGGTQFGTVDSGLSFMRFNLNLNFLPLVVSAGTLTQTLPLLPSGPYITGKPRVITRNGARFLTADIINGRGTLRWQWYKNDRPIPGPAGAVKDLPLAGSTGDSYYVSVQDRTSAGSTSVIVQP